MKATMHPFLLGVTLLATGALASRVSITAAGDVAVQGKKKKTECISAEIATRWYKAHSGAETNRINREAFHAGFAPLTAMDPEDAAAHSAFIDAVFDAGLAMMLPAVKTTLGFHCTSYAGILVGEFYNKLGAYADSLQLMQGKSADLDSDWEKVMKDGEGRVTITAFISHYQTKYQATLPVADKESFTAYLAKVFLASRMMMLLKPEKFAKGTLGGHCFRYAGLMAGEFYFGGKATNVLGLKPDVGLAGMRWTWMHADVISHRVDREMFLQAFEGSSGWAEPFFGQFLSTVFDAATAMMLPAVKKDLGKHCFGYAVIMGQEWYNASGFANDTMGLVDGKHKANCMSEELALMRTDLKTDFDTIVKNPEGRVELANFITYYEKKFSSLLGVGEVAPYRTYLTKAFYAGRAMMLQLGPKFASKTLGEHCFKYAGLMANEFYFKGTARNVLKIQY